MLIKTKKCSYQSNNCSCKSINGKYYKETKKPFEIIQTDFHEKASIMANMLV